MDENLTHYCFSIAKHFAEDPQVRDKLRTKGAGLKEVLWPAGSFITIRFLEGDPELRSRVEAIAREWLKHANRITFEFVEEGDADIRIAFKQGAGSWSYLGTVCKSITDQTKPTMNFGWLTPQSTDDELRPVVLHEFGHALGLIHEHQNPQGAIKWNKAAVIKELSGPPNNWDPATIESNMFHLEPVDAVIATPVDKFSIMMYPVPKSWTLDGFSAGFNKDLSVDDKLIAKTAYPK